jgi:hypothetical protein
LKLEGFKGGAKSPLDSFKAPQLSAVLNDKEAKEYKEKMVGTLHTIFRYIDVGITATNREKATAVIWSDIDDEDLTTLVEVIIDSGKRSRIVATAVKQAVRANNLLKVGVITAPRFMATIKHYSDHGGFVFPFFAGQKETIEA